MRLSAVLLALGLAATWTFAQATQPSNIPLDFRANQAYNQGRYAVALPLLQELAGNYYDQPDKRGPIEERINVCKKAIDAAKQQQAKATAGTGDPSLVAAAPVSLSEGRHPHDLPKQGEVVDMAIKELGNFDYDQQNGGNIPDDVTRLSGCTFRTRGYMIPLDQAENISEFALVPSLFSCCFGQPPQTQHTIIVHLPAGKGINYFPDELVVQGTLKVEEKKDEGFIVSIFDIDATSVKLAAQ